MMERSAHLVKVIFERSSYNVELPMLPTLSYLQRVVSSMMLADDRALTSHMNQLPSPLDFSYWNPSRGRVTLSNDSELGVALRSIVGELEVSATIRRASQHLHQLQTVARDPCEATDRLYRIATMNLRARGIPSLKTLELMTSMQILKVCRHRLVVQGLAEPDSLKGEPPTQSCRPHDCGSGSDVCTPASWSHLGSPDQNRRGIWRDFNTKTEQSRLAELFHDSSDSESDSDSDDSSVDTDEESMIDEDEHDMRDEDSIIGLDGSDDGSSENNGSDRTVLSAFEEAGIALGPCEVRALLRALGVTPSYLVLVGLVDGQTQSGTRGFSPRPAQRPPGVDATWKGYDKHAPQGSQGGEAREQSLPQARKNQPLRPSEHSAGDVSLAENKRHSDCQRWLSDPLPASQFLSEFDQLRGHGKELFDADDADMGRDGLGPRHVSGGYPYTEHQHGTLAGRSGHPGIRNRCSRAELLTTRFDRSEDLVTSY